MVQLLCVVPLQPRRRRRAVGVSSQDPSSAYAMTSESVYSAPVSHVGRELEHGQLPCIIPRRGMGLRASIHVNLFVLCKPVRVHLLDEQPLGYMKTIVKSYFHSVEDVLFSSLSPFCILPPLHACTHTRYASSLRQLKKHALVLSFPPTITSRLAGRLQQVSSPLLSAQTLVVCLWLCHSLWLCH